MRTSIWVLVAMCIALLAILFLNTHAPLSFWDGLAVGFLGVGIADWLTRRFTAPPAS